MSNDTEFGYKTRQALNQGLEHLDNRVATRLHEARQRALPRQRLAVGLVQLAAAGRWAEIDLAQHARTMLAVFALVVGAAGTHYWNAYSQAQEFEEIDSALLSDELPPSAYLDKGFHAWLERSSELPSE